MRFKKKQISKFTRKKTKLKIEQKFLNLKKYAKLKKYRKYKKVFKHILKYKTKFTQFNLKKLLKNILKVDDWFKYFLRNKKELFPDTTFKTFAKKLIFSKKKKKINKKK